MGRKSTKLNKNIFQLKREECELTRESASELAFLSADRIQDIENENGAAVRPEEVLILSDVYKAPNLCNHYCSHECPIGKQYVPEVKLNLNLFEIIVKTVNSINKLDNQKDRLLEIISDGLLDDEEMHDFLEIQYELEKISLNIEALQLWLEYQIDLDAIDEDRYLALKKKIWEEN